MKPHVAPETEQPASFAFADTAKVDAIIAKYPKGKQQSAIMPLLDLAQRETGAALRKASDKGKRGNWVPRAAMDEIARILDVAPMDVYEVATFYSMYSLTPMGTHHIQVCTTTPCWLCGSSKVVEAVQEKLGIHVGETTADGMFTLTEVECLGACVNAPMAQIGDDYFEDLTAERIKEIIDLLYNGVTPPVGSQTGRKGSMALSGPTTLLDDAKKVGATS